MVELEPDRAEVFVEEDVVACKAGSHDWCPGLRFISRGVDPIEMGAQSDSFVEFWDKSMCWIEPQEGVQILPITVKFAEMALLADEDRMRQALWAAIETLQRSGKRIVDSMRSFMQDHPCETTATAPPVDDQGGLGSQHDVDDDEDEEDDDAMGVDERDYHRDQAYSDKSFKGSAKGTFKSLQPNWWKGLQSYDGDAVQCRDKRGVLRVSDTEAKVECESEIKSGATVLLTLSGFEIASGHGGKNARRSIKLVASGEALGDAAAAASGHC